MDYAEKINALLAKAADSTTNAAERDTFTEAAERLMVKWGVSDAMLSDAAQRDTARKPQQIEQRSYRVEGTSAHYIAELVNAIAARGIGPIHTFICRGRPWWWAVGYSDDLRRVELYVPHLAPQARKAWQKFWRAEGWDSTGGSEYERARSSFFRAYGETVERRFRDLFADEVSATTGAELVLVNRSERVSEFVESLNVRKVYDNRSIEWSALHAGRRAGHEADLSAGALAR